MSARNTSELLTIHHIIQGIVSVWEYCLKELQSVSCGCVHTWSDCFISKSLIQSKVANHHCALTGKHRLAKIHTCTDILCMHTGTRLAICNMETAGCSRGCS